MKKFKLLFLIVLSIFLVGCANSKTSITGDKFMKEMSDLGYSVKDVLSNYDYAVSAYNAYKGDISVFFLKGKKKYDVEGVFLDEYQNLYNEIGEKFEKKLTNGTDWTSLILKNDETVNYISWIKDSYIIIKAPKSNLNEVKKVIKTLGY